MAKRYLGIRIEAETFEKIDEAAQQERRTVSNFIRKILEEWVAAESQPKKRRG